MLKVINGDLDRYPLVAQNKDKELFLIIQDHCDYLRIVSLNQGGHIYSAEYTTLEEILNEYRDFKIVNAEIKVVNYNERK
jgi:hypothetical protein